MTVVVSSAAIAVLSVPPSVLSEDLVLQYLLKTISSRQVRTESTQDTAATWKLTLGADASVVLTQRGAILRALAALPIVTDMLPYPSKETSSHKAMILSGITAWMSVADSVRTSQSSADDDILPALNRHLESHSFLHDSLSLADLDLAAALLQLKEQPNYPPQVARWLRAVRHVWITAGVMNVPAVPVAKTVVVPVFYNGTESFTLPKPVVAVSAAGAAPPKQQPVAKATNNKTDKKGAKTKEAAPAAKPALQQDKAEFDVSALDIRVGKIVKVWHHETADKLFCESIDLGTETREIASGLRPFYKTEDLQDQMVLVLCNLKARALVGFKSHGMVLCASNKDHTAVELVQPPAGAVLGERVAFGDYQGDPEPENKVAKKKIFEAVAPDLKTNAHGHVVWKEAVASVSSGTIKAQNGMTNASVS